MLLVRALDAVVRLRNEVVRPRHEVAAPRLSPAQALLRGVYYYIGVGAGSWVGGRIVKARGFHALYVAGAVGMAAWMAAWALLLRAWRPRPAAAALAPAEASTEVF